MNGWLRKRAIRFYFYILYENPAIRQKCCIDTARQRHYAHLCPNFSIEDVEEIMKAIIMAGGEGSRLRPLTCDCPKPMVRLMNKPIMEYAIELLKAHGITKIAATLGYQPDAIVDHFGDGSDFGIELQWFIEEKPLGTAGGVRQAKAFLDEPFIVLSGDGVTDLNLTELIQFHQEKHALATMVLRREKDPSEYGVVCADSDGRIRRFCEKPGRCDLISDTINTGVYLLQPELLDRIPENQPYDFGHDLFPKLAEDDDGLFGYIMNGYWCDVGDVPAYLHAHEDVLNGRIHLPSLLPYSGRTTILPGAQVAKDAILESPCLIGPGAQVHSGAYIGAHSVLGENSVVEIGANLKKSILWPGAQVRANAHARGCVLGTNAVLDVGAQSFEESVLGTGAHVGERAVILPGVRLWPGKAVADGARAEANLVWGSRGAESFAAGTILLTSPAQATRIAQCYVSVLQPKELLLGRGPSAVSDALWHAIAAGAMSLGVQVLDAGVCSLPQLRYIQETLHTDAAALVENGALFPLNEWGARLASKAQRSINALNARHDYSGPFTALTHPIRPAGLSELAYAADLTAIFSADPADAPKLAVHAQSPHLLSLAERAFSRAGLTARFGWEEAMMELAPGELGVWLDELGEKAILADENGALTEAEQQLMLAWTALESGETELLLPVSATRAAAELAESYGARATFVSGEPALWMNLLAERSPLQFRLHFDGLHFALSAVSRLTELGGSLADWRAQMPSICRRSRTVEVPVSETARILRSFAEEEPTAELGGGVRFTRDDGWAWVCPDERRPVFRIVTESVSAEFARELCDLCENRLKNLL